MPATFCNNGLLAEVDEHFANRSFGQHNENRVVVIPHSIGCCSVGIDDETGLRVLQNTMQHPNVGGVVVVNLGCGAYCSTADATGFSNRNGRLVKVIGTHYPLEVVVQADGGRAGAVARICDAVELLIKRLAEVKRVEVPLSVLSAGVMNGSSDPTSGLFANPAVGHYCDALLSDGGRVLFGQTTETIGAEALLLKRATSEPTQIQTRRLLETVTMLRMAVEREGVECEPTQGNIRSGISTLAEKSIGTVAKIGADARHRIVEVVPYGKNANTKPGIHFVDTPGQDVLCLTGLVAAGAGIMLFTTGRGAPTGSPIVPTIKITANRTTAERLPDVIDVCIPAEEIFEKGRSLREVALETLVPFIRDVASGKQLTASEQTKQRDFQVRQLWLIE
jgi:altronate dehydratase large subunit